ncbi:MAG: hypothetical protein OEW15_17660 [Nitrospirota bacterium]|nr:hypothetical protein [Nitrospirota bacterium]
MTRATAILVLILMVCGCAPTPYRPGEHGVLIHRDGYFDSALDAEGKNLFEIRFEGNGFTNEERAADYLLLRASEVTLEQGYGYFIIVHLDKRAQPGNGYDRYIYLEKPLVRMVASGSFKTSPRGEADILCFKDKPEVSYGTVYEARPLAESLRARYVQK